MENYEITIAKPNGDWVYWRTFAQDFQDAVEQALQSTLLRDRARLIRVERLSSPDEGSKP